MQLWLQLILTVGGVLGGGVFGAIVRDYFKYRSGREARKLRDTRDRETMVMDITAEVRKESADRQKSADELMAQYRATLEKIIEAQDRKIEANQTKIDALEFEVKSCEKKCDECDTARQKQQEQIISQSREIHELRLLVLKTEGGKGTAFITSDEQGVIVEWNEMATVLFKHTRAEAIGRHISIVIPTKYQEVHGVAYEMAMQTGKLKEVNTDWRDLPAVDAMGNEVPVSIRLSVSRVNKQRRVTAELKERAHKEV